MPVFDESGGKPSEGIPEEGFETPDLREAMALLGAQAAIREHSESRWTACGSRHRRIELWVAMIDGWSVVRLDDDGEFERTLASTRPPTMVLFRIPERR